MQNPIAIAQILLKDYRNSIETTFAASGLTLEDIETIFQDLEIDKDMFLSLNRAYRSSARTFEIFCREVGLLDRTYELFSIKTPRLYQHQEHAIAAILRGETTIVSTGTGSGKTESFLIPIIDHCLNHTERGIKAIIIYPMNALAADQMERIEQYTEGTNITFGLYVGSTPANAASTSTYDSPNRLHTRTEMQRRLPDILITNYVMLDWMLTNPDTRTMFERSTQTLRYVVLDELHTYRGSKATHLRHLLARLRYAVSERTPVYIGTSATLATKTDDESYLAGDIDTRLELFVKSLLDVDSYTYVEPEFEESSSQANAYDALPVPLPLYETKDWYFGNLDEEVFGQLTELLGRQFSSWDYSEAYQILDEHPVIQSIREALYEAPQRLSDLAKRIAPLFERPVRHPENVLKGYVIAAETISNRNKNRSPILDYRVHIFICSIGGYLKRCLSCQKYHSGRAEFCPDCGYPLFHVYKNNVRQCIGKITDGRLHWQLRTESADQKMAYFVLIDDIMTDPEIEPIYNTELVTSENEFRINPANDEEAGLSLIPLPYEDYADLEAAVLIPLTENRRDYQQLHRFLNTLILGSGKKKHVLGFIDNRDRASRLSTVLRDEFASAFLHRLSCFVLANQGGASIPVTQVIPLIQSYLPQTEQQSDLERAVLADLPLWFFREIGTPARLRTGSDTQRQLQFDDAVQLCNEMETALIELFLAECAFTKPFSATPKERYIRFQTYWATAKRGFHVKGNASQDSNLRTIALSDNPTSTYYPFIVHQGLRHTLNCLTQMAYLEQSELEDADREQLTRLQTYLNVLQVAQQAADNKEPFIYILKQRLPDTSNLNWIAAQGEKLVWATIGSLLARGILIAEQDHVFLNIDYVRLVTDKVQTTDPDYESVRKNALVMVALHSSDVDHSKRTHIQKLFKESDELHFVLATPTLEMGIDIGELQYVLCFGVPPMPSSYAQRAGRAGRKKEERSALIVTFCEEENSHDMHYFAAPIKMIAGVISPPRFDPHNIKITQRHINALLLADYAGSPHELGYFIQRAPAIVEEKLETLYRLFNPTFDVKQYILEELLPYLRNIWQQARRRNLRSLFYEEGIYPDYSFRKDEVGLIDAEQIAPVTNDELDNPIGEWHDSVATISSRPPELAYVTFAPGQSVYAGGEIYTVQPKGEYNFISKHPAIRQYSELYARRERFFAAKDRPIKSYARHCLIETTPSDPNSPLTKPIVIHPVQLHTLTFINEGVRKPSGIIEPFEDEDETSFTIGYQLQREGLLIEFDYTVCVAESLWYSFAAALMRTIKDRFGLDESEISTIKVVPQNVPVPTHNSVNTHEQMHIYILLYDTDGNGNVPFQKISADIGDLLRWAYEKLTTCSCEKGCYLCLWNYQTRYMANQISKEQATMLTGYLCGERRFEPSIQPPTNGALPTLEITFGLSGSQLHAKANGKSFTGSIEGDQNESIFRFLAEVVASSATQQHRKLRLRTNLKYIRDAINDVGKVKSGVFSFNMLQLQLLRFEQVESVTLE